MTRRQWAKSLLGLVVVPVFVLLAVVGRQVSDHPWPLGTTILVAVAVSLGIWMLVVVFAAIGGSRTARMRQRFPGAVTVNSLGMDVTSRALVAIGGSQVHPNQGLTLVFDGWGLRAFEGARRDRLVVAVHWRWISGITRGVARDEVVFTAQHAVLVIVQAVSGTVVVPFAVVTDFFGAADEYWLRDRIREIEAIRPATPTAP